MGLVASYLKVPILQVFNILGERGSVLVASWVERKGQGLLL